jgi:hypothetical protein
VISRGFPLPGLGAALAIVAVVGLLAAGFGVLGGRPDPSPAATTAAGSSGTVARATPILFLPLVTPWADCAAPPTSAPEVLLEVGGRATPGQVELLARSPGLASPDQSSSPDDRPDPTAERVDIPIDVTTELWIAGGACALDWDIRLETGEILETVRNRAVESRYAAQNRFNLVLAPFEGGKRELTAVLVFPTLTARVTWSIRVLPFVSPVATLRWAEVQVTSVEGCELVVWLGGSSASQLSRCDEDASRDPGKPVVVRSKERGAFDLGGLQIDGATMTCGHLSGLTFVPDPAGCSLEADVRDGVAVFDRPERRNVDARDLGVRHQVRLHAFDPPVRHVVRQCRIPGLTLPRGRPRATPRVSGSRGR